MRNDFVARPSCQYLFKWFILSSTLSASYCTTVLCNVQEIARRINPLDGWSGKHFKRIMLCSEQLYFKCIKCVETVLWLGVTTDRTTGMASGVFIASCILLFHRNTIVWGLRFPDIQPFLIHFHQHILSIKGVALNIFYLCKATVHLYVEFIKKRLCSCQGNVVHSYHNMMLLTATT